MYYEILHFRIKPDYTLRDVNTAIITVYEQFWQKQNGFLESSLAKTKEGIFVHIMLWENENCLKLCQKEMLKYQKEFAFFEIVDPGSVEQYSGEEILKRHNKSNIT